MTKSLTSLVREQTRGEEIANSISHGMGFLIAVAVSPMLIVSAVQQGSSAGVVGATIFAFTMVLLYFTSAFYHALVNNKVKQLFQHLDHCAIFLLIAGTYTPFTLGVLSGVWGWTLLGLVWGMAILGIILKSVGGAKGQTVSTLLYLAMGWLIVIAVKPLYLNMPPWGIFWLVSGGVAYTAGVGFYVADQMKYAHFIWHLFVMAGTTCHFIAVLEYAV